MNTSSGGWLTGTLVDAVPLTDSARSLTFQVPGWPGNDAGQHVDIRLTAPDGYQAVRSYSIATAGPGEALELAVERLPDGEVSPFLVDELEIGDTVELRGPLGRWFVWRPEQTAAVQLIAGGSGVVPLVAMARVHTRSEAPSTMRLLYSLRGPADALYREELSAMPGATTWHYTRSAPPGWPRAARRLTAEDLMRETLPPADEPLTYICGPTGFVEAVAAAMLDVGHAADRIRTERFGGV